MSGAEIVFDVAQGIFQYVSPELMQWASENLAQFINGGNTLSDETPAPGGVGTLREWVGNFPQSSSDLYEYMKRMSTAAPASASNDVVMSGSGPGKDVPASKALAATHGPGPIDPTFVSSFIGDVPRPLTKPRLPSYSEVVNLSWPIHPYLQQTSVSALTGAVYYDMQVDDSWDSAASVAVGDVRNMDFRWPCSLNHNPYAGYLGANPDAAIANLPRDTNRDLDQAILLYRFWWVTRFLFDLTIVQLSGTFCDVYFALVLPHDFTAFTTFNNTTGADADTDRFTYPSWARTIASITAEIADTAAGQMHPFLYTSGRVQDARQRVQDMKADKQYCLGWRHFPAQAGNEFSTNYELGKLPYREWHVDLPVSALLGGNYKSEGDIPGNSLSNAASAWHLQDFVGLCLPDDLPETTTSGPTMSFSGPSYATTNKLLFNGIRLVCIATGPGADELSAGWDDAAVVAPEGTFRCRSRIGHQVVFFDPAVNQIDILHGTMVQKSA